MSVKVKPLTRKEQAKIVLHELSNLEQKLKFNTSWNQKIKDLYKQYNVYTFEDLIRKDLVQAQVLVISFKD
jgi:hypothetical protein